MVSVKWLPTCKVKHFVNLRYVSRKVCNFENVLNNNIFFRTRIDCKNTKKRSQRYKNRHTFQIKCCGYNVLPFIPGLSDSLSLSHFNRAPIPMHPSTPMKEGEPVTFRIDPVHFTRQQGREPCKMSARTFRVLKRYFTETSDPEDDDEPVRQTYLYAVAGRPDFKEIANGNQSHKYENQVAYIGCRHGYIYMLKVFLESLETYHASVNPVKGRSRDNEKPRGCGIGVVLTELCLEDPQLNNMHYGNYAMMELEDFPAEYEMANRYCVKLVALEMAANPIRGAHVYFSSAIRAGYNTMLVEQDTGLNVYQTAVAQEKFNRETGIIQPCCKISTECSAAGRTWYFCTEK